MPVRNHRKAARANTAKHTTAIGTSSERSRPSRLPKNGDRTPESIDEPSVCIVRIGSTTVWADELALRGADDLVAAECLRLGLHPRPQRLDGRVVERPDEELVAIVEVLGVDPVADVDEALGGELTDVAGPHLIDSEAHGAVVGVDGRADEDDVGQRLDRTADRNVDERLASWRCRILLGGGDGGRGEQPGGH